ncbi:unnamed protein product, partial [marine sediment metagenome]
DKKIDSKEEVVKGLYDDIDNKLKEVKKNTDLKSKLSQEETNDEEIEKYEIKCPECKKDFDLELDEDDDLDGGVNVECPNCNEEVAIHKRDVK